VAVPGSIGGCASKKIVVRFAKHNLNHCSKSLQTVRRPNDDDDGRGGGDCHLNHKLAVE